MKVDQDIEFMLRIELKAEILKLRNAIRAHQIDCDDDALYFTLPEVTKHEKQKSIFQITKDWFKKCLL